MKKYLSSISFTLILFSFLNTTYSQNPLTIFNNLIGKTWKAEGHWGDGSPFKQELTFRKDLEGKLIYTKSKGFINEEKTKLGDRNFGIRIWDEKLGKITFTEYDVFGGITSGTIEQNQNGDLIYRYNYEGVELTDYWKKIDNYNYDLTIGIFENGAFTQSFLKTKMIAQNHYKDFDFWIGEWTVFIFGTDKIAGHSKIESILDGKAIQETYHNNNQTYSGTSLNKYNPTTKSWEQYWVDNSGLTLHLIGNLREGKMTLSSKPSHHKVNDKIIWSTLENGDVRQIWQQQDLTSGSEEWKTIFDGHYKRKS